MSTTGAKKILAFGAPLSSFKKLSDKIANFQKQKGPFHCCVLLGNAFKEGSDGSELTTDLEFAIPTYFMIGTRPLPETIQARLLAGPELVKNLVCLGKSGTIDTDGISLGFLGGLPTENVDSSSVAISVKDVDAMLQSNMLAKASLQRDTGNTLADIRNSNKTPLPHRGIDLLLLATPPPEITAFSRNAPTSITEPSSPDYISKLIIAARPRYLFWGAKDDEGDTGGSAFWEREPFGWDSTGKLREDRFTRAVKLDTFGGPKGAKKSVYAFILPAQSATDPLPAIPANATANPYQPGSRGQKRQALDEQHSMFQNSDQKRQKKGTPPDTYICRKCDTPGHWLEDCPEGDKMPEGYVCKICGSAGHRIKDCPDKGKKPPDGYVCRICGGSEHFIKECPSKGDAVERKPDADYKCPGCGALGDHYYRQCANYKPRETLPPISQQECWFCLSNPSVDKSLIVGIGNNTYIAMAKGQLLPTGNPQSPPLVPGGGHCLIIPIHHCNTPYALDMEIGQPTIDEIDETKGKLERLFGEYDAAPVFFELSRQSGRGGHNHVQTVPIPQHRLSELENFFMNEAQKQGFSFESDGSKAVRNLVGRNYFRVDLPGGKKLVHFMRGPFNVQFGRETLAKFLDMPNRADWKQCTISASQQKQDVQAFKKIYNSFN
ncbi:hypothetical protein NliqN6_3749 [Naganishia liquefaciens]|uniref:CCHC-type domain-containing protein n=1 Tax=Naganishia liquefaciens TaxID=104408 RepID=A0A8H3TUE0_9TREE|nr:hypothetical protein NliqN6_3749 [Naganishia liquefaciens]